MGAGHNDYGWSSGRIYTTLINRQYIGEDDNYGYQSIVDESLFIRTQEKIRLAKKIQSDPASHLLQGYVFCPTCGTRMSIIGPRYRAYFKCKGHNRQGCISNLKAIREDWLQEQVVDTLTDIINSPSVLKQAIENRLSGLQNEVARLESIVEPQKREIKRIEDRRERIGVRFEVGEIGKAEYMEKIEECQRELNGLRASQQEIDVALQREYQYQGERVKLTQKMLGNIDGKSAKIWASFQLMTSEDIRDFLKEFEVQITVSNREVDIKGLVPEEELHQVLGSVSKTRHASQIVPQYYSGINPLSVLFLIGQAKPFVECLEV